MSVFRIKGSGDNEYRVHVAPKGDDLITISCECRAGIYGKMCKHKLAVATGDPSLLLDEADVNKLADVAKEISRRPIGQLLGNLAESRNEHDAAKRKMDKAKKALEKAMKD